MDKGEVMGIGPSREIAGGLWVCCQKARVYLQLKICIARQMRMTTPSSNGPNSGTAKSSQKLSIDSDVAETNCSLKVYLLIRLGISYSIFIYLK